MGSLMWKASRIPTVVDMLLSGVQKTATNVYFYVCSEAGGDSMVLTVDSGTEGWLVFRQASVRDRGRQERWGRGAAP